jgi:hypothetical protein
VGCAVRDPDAHELDAVQIAIINRHAAGLYQRRAGT